MAKSKFIRLSYEWWGNESKKIFGVDEEVKVWHNPGETINNGGKMHCKIAGIDKILSITRIKKGIKSRISPIRYIDVLGYKMKVGGDIWGNEVMDAIIDEVKYKFNL